MNPDSAGWNPNTLVPTSCNAMGTYPVANTAMNAPIPKNIRLVSHTICPATTFRLGTNILSGSRNPPFFFSPLPEGAVGAT